MIKINMDTSAFDKKEIEAGEGLIFELQKLDREEKILLYRESYVDKESMELKGDRGEKTYQWIRFNSRMHTRAFWGPSNPSQEELVELQEKQQGFTFVEEKEIEKRVKKVLFKHNSSENLIEENDHIDCRLLTLHIATKGDYFVTNNTKDFIRLGKRDIKAELENEFPGLKIRELNETFINELKTLI